MLNSLRKAIAMFIATAGVLAASGFSAGQQKEVVAAPIPAQIGSARKVFISNGGDDTYFRELGSVHSYDHLYAAVKNWGRYELVSSPQEAEAVFQIRLTRQLHEYGNNRALVPFLEVAILDPKTHTSLWAVNRELETNLVGKHAKFDKAIDEIIGELKGLISEQASTGKP
ncbi:MAG: hypothetical protein M3O09_08380 [Acidobacteriota bacterium]|nr:hypothetical protein [Acidobacteriota bacterium]